MKMAGPLQVLANGALPDADGGTHMDRSHPLSFSKLPGPRRWLCALSIAAFSGIPLGCAEQRPTLAECGSCLPALQISQSVARPSLTLAHAAGPESGEAAKPATPTETPAS